MKYVPKRVVQGLVPPGSLGALRSLTAPPDLPTYYARIGHRGAGSGEAAWEIETTVGWLSRVLRDWTPAMEAKLRAAALTPEEFDAEVRARAADRLARV